MFCHLCGAPRVAESAYCTQCGAPPAVTATGFGWLGDRLVISPAGLIPAVPCLVCGKADGVTPTSRTFRWVPPWIYLGLLGGLIPAVILLVIFQKTSHLLIPQCDECRNRWTLLQWLVGPAYLVLFFGLPIAGGFAADAASGRPEIALAGVVAGFVLWIATVVAVNLFWLPRTQLICKRIDRRGCHLKVPAEREVRLEWGEGSPMV